jgi:hypothetical protein
MIKRMPPKRHSNSPKTMDFTMTYCPDQVRTQHSALLMTAYNEYVVRALRTTSNTSLETEPPNQTEPKAKSGSAEPNRGKNRGCKSRK